MVSESARTAARVQRFVGHLLLLGRCCPDPFSCPNRIVNIASFDFAAVDIVNVLISRVSIDRLEASSMLQAHLIALNDRVASRDAQSDKAASFTRSRIIDDIPQDSVAVRKPRIWRRGVLIDQIDSISACVDDCVSLQEIVGRLDENPLPRRILHNIVPNDILFGGRQDKDPSPMILNEVPFDNIVLGTVGKSDSCIAGVDRHG